MPRPDPRPRTRYRYGARDASARREHTEQTNEWRHDLARAVLDPVAPVLFAALGAGVPLQKACAAVGVSTVALYGRARWDADWGRRLDAAQMAGRSPLVKHGTSAGYKECLVRCPECRAAHHQSREER